MDRSPSAKRSSMSMSPACARESKPKEINKAAQPGSRRDAAIEGNKFFISEGIGVWNAVADWHAFFEQRGTWMEKSGALGHAFSPLPLRQIEKTSNPPTRPSMPMVGSGTAVTLPETWTLSNRLIDWLESGATPDPVS